MQKILQKNEAVLRKDAKEIPIHEIKTPKIQKILKEMSAALKNQEDGVALAAPQIGYPLKIFVVSGKIFSAKGGLASGEDIAKSLKNQDTEKTLKDSVFINPIISKMIG